MAKLYPPYIEGTIPAFTGGEIVVPFSMNRAVSKYEIAGFSLKIKTVQNNTFIATVNTKNYDLDTMEAYFDIDAFNQTIAEDKDKVKFNIGQFYKVQIAFIDKTNTIGYYSTVGVIKYTGEPDVYIEGLTFPGVNNHDKGYIGVYNQKDKDITEKIYTCRFTVADNAGTVVYDSGEMLHNATEDVYNYQSSDYYEVSEDLEIGDSYYIEYSVTTMNGLKRSSKKYRIVQRESIDPDLKADVFAEMNYDEGYIDVNLIGHLNSEGIEEPVVGAFLLARANKKHPGDWENLKRFSLQSELATGLIFRDCTVEQGETYIYSIQQYNDSGLYSNRLLSNEVYADFEDAFLYDGVRQLKIKYNPKVSSFKNTILETKVDTIGSKHPFIFRNGRVKYKDFPISGLISYFMDEAEMFMNEKEYMLEEKTTNLISPNQTSERLFKLEVLDWLSNGKPKMFRSPGEGNYLVRLMNVSLTPIDTVGRMLHSFNCNAYEIADCTYEELCQYNIIALKELDNVRLRWATIELLQRLGDGKYKYFTGEVLNKPSDPNQTYIAQTIEFRDMLPGDYFYLNAPRPISEMTPEEALKYKITIGATGAYRIDLMQPITSIWIPNLGTKENPIGFAGSVTFSYYGNYENAFSMISNVDMIDVPAQQFIGEQWVEKYFLDEFSGEGFMEPVNNNVIAQLEDMKTNVLKIFAMKVEKRPVEYLYVKDAYGLQVINDQTLSGYPVVDFNTSDLFFDRACTQDALRQDFKPFVIYEVRNAQLDFNNNRTHNNNNMNITHDPADKNFHRGEYYYIDRDHDKFYPIIGSYIDGRTCEVIPEDFYSTTFYYNINKNHFTQTDNLDKYYGIDLAQTEQFEMTNIEDFHDILLTNGVMLTMTYQAQVLTYRLEQEDPEVAELKISYLQSVEEYQNLLLELEKTNENGEYIINDDKSFETWNAKLEAKEKEVEQKYNWYIEELEKEIINYKEAHAIPYEKYDAR